MKTLTTLCAGLLLCACAAPDADPSSSAGAVRVDAADVTGDGTRFSDMDGAAHDLGESFAAGRQVALVYWQTWCAPCRREAPHLAAAARELAGKVDFYGVISGPKVDEARVRLLTESWELPYPQVRDRSGALARRFDVIGTPTIVVLEPSGQVSYNDHSLPESW